VKSLLHAGADPTECGPSNLNSFEYAIQDPEIWQEFEEAGCASHEPRGRAGRTRLLRQVVTRNVRWLLSHPQTLTSEEEPERLYSVIFTMGALLYLGADWAHKAAGVCYLDLLSDRTQAPWNCKMCNQTPILGEIFVCMECWDCVLCKACYSDYLSGADNQRSAPQSLKAIEDLEADLRPVRALARVYEIAPVVFSEAVTMLRPVKEWMKEKLNAYEDWEKTYSIGGRFNNHQRPGHELLKIIGRFIQAEKDFDQTRDGGEDHADQMSAVGREYDRAMRSFLRSYHEDKENSYFFCSGHQYFEGVGDPNKATEAEKLHLGSEGRMTDQFLLALLENCENGQIGGSAVTVLHASEDDVSLLADDPTLENESQRAEDPIGSLSGQGRGSVIIADEEVNMGSSTNRPLFALGSLRASDSPEESAKRSTVADIKEALWYFLLSDNLLDGLAGDLTKNPGGVAEEEPMPNSRRLAHIALLEKADRALQTGSRRHPLEQEALTDSLLAEAEEKILDRSMTYELAFSLAQLIFLDSIEERLFGVDYQSEETFDRPDADASEVRERSKSAAERADRLLY
jgi:hypothetical protein